MAPKFSLAVFLLGALLLMPAGDAAGVSPQFRVAPDKPQTNRLLARPRAGQDAAAKTRAADLHARSGARLIKRYPALRNWEVYELPKGKDAAAVRKEFLRSGLYESVEEDLVWTTYVSPNDPSYVNGTLWGLHNTGQNSGTADADIDAPEGWDTRVAADPLVVAVVDTGIRYTHEDLAANMWVNTAEIAGNSLDDDANGYVDDVHGINAITGSGDPMDDNGHGSHCAGTIGGSGNNGLGVAGVAWSVRLMAVKFLSSGGSGTTSDAIECIDYARSKGAKIMSNSWGGGGYSQALYDAIAAARDAGILFVAAAGNSASDNDLGANYPSNYELDNVVAVAATTRTDALASFSSYGAGFVDLGAPGQDIYSSVSSSDAAYASYSGTSMATPHVSGAMALLAAQFPADTPRQLINRLQRSVDPVPALAGRSITGGRLNLQKALTSASNRPFNDAFAAAPGLPAAYVNARASNAGATVEPGEPAHAQVAGSGASLWWSWTPAETAEVTVDLAGSAFDTVLGIYTGSALGSLSEVAGNDDAAPGTTTSRVTFTAVAGTTYRIAAAGKTATSAGLVRLNIRVPVANDNFADRTPLSETPVNLTAVNIGATKEPGEPNHGGNAGGRSVWWTWTAPSATPVDVNTVGSNFDTILGVYTGDAVGALTTVGGDDDSGGSFTSRVIFTPVAGTTYHFAVDGYAAASGRITLSVQQSSSAAPDNDMFVAAGLLNGNDTTVTASNAGASKEPGEPSHGGNTGGRSVWWNWTATGIGPVEINTIGSSFDTTLGVYTGDAVGVLTTVAGDDDGGGGSASRVTFTPVQGTTYRIAVDGYAAATGNITLRLRQTALNSPPVVSAAVVSPSPAAWLDQNLVVSSVTVTDPEGDPVTLRYQWQSSTDGNTFTDAVGATAETLSAQPGNSGRLWRCLITPQDADSAGTPFQTTPVAVNRRPVQTARHGMPYGYDSDLFLAGATGDFTRAAIINEFSQGPSGGTAEWIEILFLRETDARGWTLRDTNSSATVTFAAAALWSRVPAGTLLVIYNGSTTKDPALPADDSSLDDGDGRLIVSSSQAGLFTGSWPGLSNSNPDGFAVRDALGTLADGVSINGQTSFQPQLGTVGSTRAARYNGDTEAAAETAANWSVVTSAAANVSPAAGNGSANTTFISRLRSGYFDNPAFFRFHATSETLPGLSIDPVTGAITGTPDVPFGGFFRIVIERYTTTESVTQTYDLLVGSSLGVHTVPPGRTWNLSGPAVIEGSLAPGGAIESHGHDVLARPTFASWTQAWQPPRNDGDEHPLGLEYAFGLDPRTADTRPLLWAWRDGDRAVLVFRRQRAATDVAYILETTGSFSHWDPVDMASFLAAPPVPLGPDLEEVRLEVPLTSPAQVFRLKAVVGGAP